jgi:hypothetical protein
LLKFTNFSKKIFHRKICGHFVAPIKSKLHFLSTIISNESRKVNQGNNSLIENSGAKKCRSVADRLKRRGNAGREEARQAGPDGPAPMRPAWLAVMATLPVRRSIASKGNALDYL